MWWLVALVVQFWNIWQKERHNVERVLTLGYPMESIPQGTIAQIHQHYGLNVDGIINSIKEFMVLKVR